MIPKKDEHQILQELLLENQRLLAENNELLKKIHRSAIWSFWLKFVWFMIIIGAPFILYYYLIEPYFNSFGSSFEQFQEGIKEIPGWKQFYSETPTEGKE